MEMNKELKKSLEPINMLSRQAMDAMPKEVLIEQVVELLNRAACNWAKLDTIKDFATSNLPDDIKILGIKTILEVEYD